MRSGVHYALASVAAWAASLGLGFMLNRRFTFGISGDAQRLHDFVVYLTGAVLQLLVGLAGYAVLIGGLKWGATPAFGANIVVTTVFSFLFQRFITFRRAGQT